MIVTMPPARAMKEGSSAKNSHPKRIEVIGMKNIELEARATATRDKAKEKRA
jgi:hypothetical protein